MSAVRIATLPCASLGILYYATTDGGDVSPLHGDMAGSFRLRVGDYRVLFSLHEGAVRIFGVRHRSEAYR